MTPEDLIASTENDPDPPPGLSPEVRTLWYAKAGRWEEAHNIAQDLPTAMGSWLHALLHLIEGDTSNAGYWFRQAGKPKRSGSDIDTLWLEIASQIVPSSK